MVAGPAVGTGTGRHTAFVSGLHDGPALVAHDGSQHGISLDLTPLGARALLGVPGRTLSGLVVGLGDVVGPWADTVVDRLRHAPSWAACATVLDDVLCSALARGTAGAPRPEVADAWALLVASGGARTVRDLAAELGCSPTPWLAEELPPVQDNGTDGVR